MHVQDRSSRLRALAAPLALAVAMSIAAVPACAFAHSRWRQPDPVYRLRLSRSLGAGHWRRTIARRQHSLRAHSAIVNGSQIEITQAPWQTFVVGIIPINATEALFLLCGGSVLDQTHVLTAAHCLYDPLNESRIPAADIYVVAGTSNVSRVEAGEQEIKAASVRVHPDYNYAVGAGGADDVGVIEVASAFTFGQRVQSIPLAGAAPGEGASVNLTGFGKESASGTVEGPLNSLAMTVGFSRPCGGGADAVFICASAPGGSGCTGDSGSGLTEGATPTLVGVMDTVQIISGQACRDGADNGFVNATAPEIKEFVEGSEAPPLAPRGGSGITLRAVTRVGSLATCEPGSWSGSPTYTYSFFNSGTGAALQSGASSTYAITSANIGESIACEVRASNAGGTGAVRTSGLPPVLANEEPSSGPPPTPQPTPGEVQKAAEREALIRGIAEAKAREAAEAKAREEAEAIERAQREFEARLRAQKAKRQCVVPALVGDTLSRAKHALARAHCAVSRITEPPGARLHLVVTSQSPRPGRHEPAGSRVALTLGHASKHHRK
jgi:hypothetical protein